MPIINLSGKSFLREEPFNAPGNAPAFVQDHSNIYPGDPIVFYSGITLPGDAGVSSMSNIKLQSVKLRIVAEKPGVFSEEFNNVFAATRRFDLDTFQFSLNSVPVRAWGADGNAPDLNLLQDRNFKLPSGDFRRQINFFTEHPTNSTWKYWFYFPVIFRHEYWKALAAADNDFYNFTQSQQGKNHFWQHYLTSTWKIKYFCETTCLVNNVVTILRSQLNMADVFDYATNPDYGDRIIKTAGVVTNETPTASPARVYGYQNTNVYVHLTKQTAWATNEKENLSGFVWIEPFEGGGRDVRVVASSLHPITPETVFVAPYIPIDTEGGLDLETEGGDTLVTEGSGNGVEVTFDTLDDKKIILKAQIDYQKLKIRFPGVTNFTLYGGVFNNIAV